VLVLCESGDAVADDRVAMALDGCVDEEAVETTTTTARTEGRRPSPRYLVFGVLQSELDDVRVDVSMARYTRLVDFLPSPIPTRKET
jgi:hypothetical protein